MTDAIEAMHRARKPRGPARFKEKDLARVMRAAQKANMPVAAVEITPEGSILIIPGTPRPVATSAPEPNDWD